MMLRLLLQLTFLLSCFSRSRHLVRVLCERDVIPIRSIMSCN